MIKRFVFFLIIIVFVVPACDYFSKYPGYSKTKSGIYYNLLKFGESSEKAKPGDYITADIIYKTIEDSVFFEGRRRLQITEPSFLGAIDECFLMLSEGEMASFIISANDFFTKTLETTLPAFIHNEDPMIVEIDVVDILTEEEYLKEKEAFLHWIEDFGDYEKVILRQYIDEQKIEINPTESGLYHLTLEPGNGNRVFV
ncbi:MAG: hypothetical protein C0597_13430, partial [Marinilabiliales bacterium]